MNQLLEMKEPLENNQFGSHDDFHSELVRRGVSGAIIDESVAAVRKMQKEEKKEEVIQCKKCPHNFGAKGDK